MAKGKVRKVRAPSAPGAKVAGGAPLFAPTPERLARGDFRAEPIVAHVYDRDETGERAHGRKVVMGHVYRDGDSELRRRLGRYRSLDAAQIEAAVRFETDWNTAGLEPRVTLDLERVTGGGSAGSHARDPASLGRAITRARDALHAARAAVRAGGDETLRVVEAVVLQGGSSAEVGGARYRDAEKGRVYVAAMLDVGLRLLAGWYG